MRPRARPAVASLTQALCRHLFEESKAIAAETLAATKRELHSQISKLQEQVVKLEADVVEATGARSGAEEAAEKLRHEVATAKREADLLRSELATSSGEMSGKLTVRQNVTKGEICKLSAEVFTLQQNLMEQAQKSAEAGKRGAQAYQQDLVSLNGLLERSREMRERDRTTFAAALDVAHSDLRSKETELQEAQDKLQDLLDQLSSSRRHCADLLQDAENVRQRACSKDDESAERVVRAARMRTRMTLSRSVIYRWRQAVRLDYDVSAGMAGLYAKRRIANLFHQWRGSFVTRLRTEHKLDTLWQRWKVGRVLLRFLFWRRYAATRRHIQSKARRIVSRSSKFTSTATFRTWCLKASISANLRSKQVRATAHWDRACLKRCMRGMQSLSADGKYRLVHGQRLVSRICRRELFSVLHKWHCRTKDLQDQVTAFQARRSCVHLRRLLSSAFDSWSICMPSTAMSDRDSWACRFARILQHRRRIRMSYCAWQSHARARNCLRSKVLRANYHIVQARKGRAIRSLRAHARLRKLLALQHKRVLAKSARTLLAGTMRTWWEMWMNRKTCYVRNLRCAVRLRRSRLVTIVQKWKAGGAEVRVEMSLMRKAGIRYMNKLTMRAFARMVDNRFESCTLKRRNISIAHRRLTKLCSWSLNRWTHSIFAHWHRSKRDAVLNLRRYRHARAILQKSTTWWLEYTSRRVFTARLVKSASSKRAQASITAALLTWQLLLRRSLAVKSAKTRKFWLLRVTTLNAWSHLTDLSRMETSNQKEIDRLSCELKETKNDLEVASSRDMDAQEQLNQLHDVRIPALESENMRMSETLELAQMELEAKKAEALSTKTQVTMLQDTIAEMRGFLNDPDLNLQSNADEKSAASIRKELEAERRNAARLHCESLHKDAEISQLTSQVAAMEQKVARAQKSIDSLETQTSLDIQVSLNELENFVIQCLILACRVAVVMNGGGSLLCLRRD
jgi:predicted  nucleic acid-binding Zn-ribbon protein